MVTEVLVAAVPPALWTDGGLGGCGPPALWSQRSWWLWSPLHCGQTLGSILDFAHLSSAADWFVPACLETSSRPVRTIHKPEVLVILIKRYEAYGRNLFNLSADLILLLADDVILPS